MHGWCRKMKSDRLCQTMDNIQRQSPIGSPNCTAGAIYNVVRLRHFSRPEILAHVCARCFRKHEVVRDVVGTYPLRGPDHQRSLVSPRAHAVARRTFRLQSQSCGVLNGVCNQSRADALPQPAVDNDIDDSSGGGGAASLESFASYAFSSVSWCEKARRPRECRVERTMLVFFSACLT